MHYYTYAYLREDKTPYYIGKGKGDRINSKKRSIKPPKDKSRIIYLKQNLTEEEAFKHEIYMIFLYGRKDLGTGILHNMTNGGEGSSGAIRSEETKKKISEANKGKIFSEETKRKLSEAHKNPTEETRIKMSEANKGKIFSEETKKKISEALKGNTYCLGRTLSEETKRKMSEAKKNQSEETRKKISEAKKGSKCWNDGCGNIKYMVECPGDGWKPGMK